MTEIVVPEKLPDYFKKLMLLELMSTPHDALAQEYADIFVFLHENYPDVSQAIADHLQNKEY